MAHFAARTCISLGAGLTVMLALAADCMHQDEGPIETGTVGDQGVMLHSIAFSRDASHVVVVGNCWRVYELKSGELVSKVDFRRRIQAAAFSPAEGNVF